MLCDVMGHIFDYTAGRLALLTPPTLLQAGRER
jgi:hypothetical protein